MEGQESKVMISETVSFEFIIIYTASIVIGGFIVGYMAAKN